MNVFIWSNLGLSAELKSSAELESKIVAFVYQSANLTRKQFFNTKLRLYFFNNSALWFRRPDHDKLVLPEKLSAAGELVWWEVVKQLSNVIVKVRLPKMTSPFNAVAELFGFVINLKKPKNNFFVHFKSNSALLNNKGQKNLKSVSTWKFPGTEYFHTKRITTLSVELVSF